MTPVLFYPAGKRLLDIVCAGAALIVLSPIFVGLALYLKWRSPGPVFYKGVRVGLNGRLFRILKYRSMVEGAELLGGSATANDDPRLTRAGKLLRRYKLDELPQLINVLLGDMSLVGPRPEVKKYTEMYTEQEQQILELRPGLTDWATIWDADEGEALAGSPDPEKVYEEAIRPTKIRLQLYYVNNRSFYMDLQILAHTMIKLFVPTWTPAAIAGYEPPCEARLRATGAKQMSGSFGKESV